MSADIANRPPGSVGPTVAEYGIIVGLYLLAITNLLLALNLYPPRVYCSRRGNVYPRLFKSHTGLNSD